MSGNVQAPASAQVLPISPSLSSASISISGTSAALSVTTDQASGKLYWVLSTSSTPPSVAQVMAGQDASGSAAVAHGSQVVTSTGVQNASASGLNNGTTYYAYFMQANARFLSSTVAPVSGGAGGGGAFNFSQPADSGLLALLEDI